jgi:hypothetical protein
MAGKKHRQRRLDEESRPWNIVFPVALIAAVRVKAEEEGVTPAALVRGAVERYLSDHTAISGGIVTANAGGNEYMRGVHEAAAALRSIVTQPRYPAGNTLGDVLAQKVIDKIESDGRQNT